MSIQQIKRVMIATSVVGFLMTLGVQKAMAQPLASGSLSYLADHELSGETKQTVAIDGVHYEATESFTQKSEVTETDKGVQVIRTTVEILDLKELD